MNEFIRMLYDSEISGIRDVRDMPANVVKSLRNRDLLHEKLKNDLSSENFGILEEFVCDYDIVENEKQLYAFYCGLKFAMQVFSAIEA